MFSPFSSFILRFSSSGRSRWESPVRHATYLSNTYLANRGHFN